MGINNGEPNRTYVTNKFLKCSCLSTILTIQIILGKLHCNRRNSLCKSR